MTDVYAARRKRVLERIVPGALILPSAPLTLRNNDVEHEYRQDSDFYYLTGFDEPESVLLLKAPGEHSTVLFVRPRDKEREVWDGPRAGIDGAVAKFGADAAFPVAEVAAKLADSLENVSRLYYRFGRRRDFDEVVFSALETLRGRARKSGSTYPTEFIDPQVVLHELRRIKEPREIDLMVRAAEISREGHLAAMAAASPGMHEYEIEAILRGVFRRGGAERSAYAPIVGSGPNTTVLHYVRNDRKMCDGDLLLIDAGCEYGYYASDVTRTFPVSGRFSEPQRRIYELVLEAQLASIATVRAGATFDEVHRASVDVITRGLFELGLVEGPVEKAIEEERFKKYFMHKTGHYLGMDVHDVGTYFNEGSHRAFDPGVVLTVEPGIYIASDDETVPEAFRGIGVRIEDDVLVTPEGHRVLSEGIPKSVADVERACAA